MSDPNPPLPSTRTLLLSTAAAAVLASLVLVTAVLPAEWGIDPTGIGRAIGLVQLGGVEDTEFEGDAAGAGAASNLEAAGEFREDTAEIEIPAGSGLEYKLRIAKGMTLDYDWKASRGSVFAELHGEPAGDKSGYFEDFNVSRGESVKGSLETRFEGRHGWYWKNDNDFPVTITLTTRGIYEIIGKLTKTRLDARPGT